MDISQQVLCPEVLSLNNELNSVENITPAQSSLSIFISLQLLLWF